MRREASEATACGSSPSCQWMTLCPSTSIPRRPARPVSWVYSPGVMGTRASPLNFSSFSSTTVRAGMLMPSARVSVAKTTFSSLLLEELLDDLLEGGQQAGVVGGDARARGPRATPSSRAPRGPRRAGCGSGPRRSRGSRPARQRSVSRMPSRIACRTAASQPARLKMKKIAGSRFRSREQVDHVAARHRRSAAGAGRSWSAAAAPLLARSVRLADSGSICRELGVHARRSARGRVRRVEEVDELGCA